MNLFHVLISNEAGDILGDSLIPDIDGLLENAQARCSEIFERNLGITIGKMSVHTIVDNGLYNHYKRYMDDSKVDYDYDAARNHFDEAKASFASKGVTGLMIFWNINYNIRMKIY